MESGLFEKPDSGRGKDLVTKGTWSFILDLPRRSLNWHRGL
jgi:hypothetical protein